MRRLPLKLNDWAGLALFALVFSVPFGTRYIWSVGRIAGVSVEWGTVSLYASQLLALAVVALGGWLAVRRGRFFGRTRVALLALALAGLAVLSALLAALDASIVTPLLPAAWVIVGAMLLIVIDAWRPAPRLLAAAWFASAVVQAVLALIQLFLQKVSASKWVGMASQQAADLGTFVVETADGRWLRAYGSFGHPNILGFWLAVGLAMAIGLLIELASDWRRSLIWAGLPVIGAGLLASFSRSAALAFLVAGLATGAACHLMRRADWAKRSWLALALALSGFTLMAAFLPDLTGTRLLGSGRLEVRSVSQRVSLSADAWELIRRQPVWGVGPGQMPYAAHRLMPDGRLGYDYQPAHNQPLLIAAEIGLLGLLAWLGLLVSLSVRLVSRFRRLRRRPAPNDVWLPTAAGLAAAGLTVLLLDHFLWSLWPGQLTFWLLAGFLAVAAASRRTA